MSTPSSTMASVGKSSITSGPYKATQLWNDVLQAFKTNVPVGKRRRHIKTYDKCFVASEAINWLLFYLQNSPNFGPHVTRDNAVQLLQKFHKLGIFEDVRGVKYNKEQFDDGGRLFRFVNTSPTKSDPTPSKEKEASKNSERSRPPLSARTVFMNTDRKAHTLPPSMEKVKLEAAASNQALSQCHLVARRTISPLEIEELWKTITLSRLKDILQAELIEDIFSPNCVNARHIMHNVTHINRNGVVTNLDRKDHVPPWVLSIMKCLAHWPEETEEGLPNYPNFERDMFKTVESYYKALGEPLITCDLYEAFTNAYIAAKYRNCEAYPNSLGNSPQSLHSHHDEFPSDEQDSIRAYASMENLMMNLTMQGGMLEDDEQQYYHPASRGTCYGSRDNMLSKSQNGVNSRDYMGMANGQTNEPVINTYALPPQRHYNDQAAKGFNKRASQKHQSSSHSIAETGRGGGVGVARRPNCRSQSSLHGRTDCEGHERLQHAEGNTSDYCSNDGSSGSYNQRNAQEGRQDRKGASSVWSVYSQFQVEDEEDEEEDCPSLGSQKCLSLADLATIKPGPENDLSRSERVKSWINMQTDEPDMQDYVQPVVTSTTPKPLRARKSQQQQARSRSYSQREIEQELPYSYQPKEEPWYAQSEKVTKKKRLSRSRSEVGGGMLGRATAPPPPPYVPPPSYKSSIVSSGATPRAYNAVYAQGGHAGSSVWGGSNHSSSPSCRSEPRQKQSSHSSRVNLQESYRMAMYTNDTAMTPPVSSRFASCQPLYRNLHLAVTSPNVCSPEIIAQVSEALRLLCLFLPPGNRRKLHLLLRLMWRMEDNYHLVLDPHVSNRHLLLTTFTSCILQSRDNDGHSNSASNDLARSIVEFMVDNHQQIFSVPPDLKDEVENNLTKMKQTRSVPSWDESPTSITYCQQVTPQEYEQQRLSNSQMELRNLLDAIVADEKLSPKKKKKKIKHFQKAHPDIYARRFPVKEAVKESHGGKPKIKQPLLSKPLQKFKSIRI